MSNLMRSLILILGVTLIMPAKAADKLMEARLQTVRQYFWNIENKNVEGMSQLFVRNGTVVSTSKGKLPAKEFFAGFLPALNYAKATPSLSYIATNSNEHFAAQFHLNYKLKDGEEGGGTYMDDFLFAKNSNKLVSVAMFENTKF